MRIFLALLFFLSFFSCNTSKEKHSTVYAQDFGTILQQNDLIGTILIYDQQSKTYYSNNFIRANTGFLPASTFKIPNTLIALDSKTIISDSSIIKWDGEKRRLPDWEKDLTLRDAFQTSCVPCYQEVARKIGTEKMNTYLHNLTYPKMFVNDSTIDNFWLRGQSKITAFEQIQFLKKFHNRKLPISKLAYEAMFRIMLLEQTDNYKLYGKTGWSNENNINNGWFVGLVEKDNKTYYFATNVEPKDPNDLKNFISARKQVTIEALTKMNIIKT